MHLVESIPVGLYPSTPSALRSTADSWLSLLDKANSSVHIAAVYLTLRGSDVEFPDSTDSQVSTVAICINQQFVKILFILLPMCLILL